MKMMKFGRRCAWYSFLGIVFSGLVACFLRIFSTGTHEDVCAVPTTGTVGTIVMLLLITVTLVAYFYRSNPGMDDEDEPPDAGDDSTPTDEPKDES